MRYATAVVLTSFGQTSKFWCEKYISRLTSKGKIPNKKSREENWITEVLGCSYLDANHKDYNLVRFW